jgi:2-polyprenyl-3-methyl-5-hydroxy-6-metoxy-1,4-benzoquinol methylase
MVQPRKLVILAGAAAAALAVLRHGRHAARGHQAPGGILIGDAVRYDTLSRLLLSPFLARIAADIAAAAPDGARVLEVGCGPGHLSTRLGRHGFDVTGLDLDPAMIARARANTDRGGNRGGAGHRSWSATWPL